MRKTLLASAAVLGMALAIPALAQNDTAAPGSRGVIVPPLPQPNLPANASPADYLQAARQAVQQRHGGAAEAALSDAETRLLNRSVAPSAATEPDRSPAVQDIEQARAAVGRHDWQGADQRIAAALQHAQMAASGNRMTMPPGQTSAMPAMSGSGPAVGTSGMVRTPPAATAPGYGDMTTGTHSVPMGGVMPPNGGVMAPNGGVMPPNLPQ